VPCFQRAGVQTLATLAAQARELRFDTNDAPRVFVSQGDERALVVMAHGEVEVEHPWGTIQRSRRGDLLGGPAAFARGAKFTVRATHPSLALSIAAEDLVDVMEEHFDLTRSIMMSLVAHRDEHFDALGVAHPKLDADAPLTRRAGDVPVDRDIQGSEVREP
jgi:hypothetical protein